MNSLFLGILTLLLSQGLGGRDAWGARLVATLFFCTAALAFIYSLTTCT
jgi:hypothetical protein